MSEFSFQPNTSKKIKISSLLLADLFNLCFCILSHPLYFSYFIFFSPYLLKLLSFLSPLFITTALLVLAYLTVQNDVADSESCKIKLGCLVTAYQTVFEGLQKSKVDDSDGGDRDRDRDQEEFRSFVELEAYKIVFDTSTFEINETPVEENCSQVFVAQVEDVSSHEANGASDVSDAASDVFDDKFEIPAEAFVQEEENWPENLCKKEEEEEVTKPPPSTESKKVEKQEQGKEKGSLRRGESKDYLGDGDELNSKLSMVNSQTLGANLGESMANSQTLGSNVGECYNNMSPNLGSFGSMRKEKEWRRTLACKLFEERHQNVDGGGGEGMDMLWETYDETESLKVVKGKKSKSKKGKNGKVESNDGDEEEEEEEFDGQLCCLQALKFSAGKMNLGMGRPNLVKFSKALKGFGWLHHVTKHGKKGHH